MMTQAASIKKRVLAVDDEPDLLAYYASVLGDQGYEVVTAGTAEEARAWLEDAVPDVISLDIMMPMRSGISLYREIKLDERLKGVPAIFISAFSLARDFDERGFRKLVPDQRVPQPAAFLEKPVDPEKLVEIVGKVIGNSDQLCSSVVK